VGIRETLNRNSGITTGAVGGIVVLAIIYIIYYVSSGSGAPAATVNDGRVWYTADDGQTFFVDSANKTPPFDYNGKQAVQCHVFTCNKGKTKFVGYLQRYTPKAKARREELIAKRTMVGMEEVGVNGVEIKLPHTGDRGWVNYNEPRAAFIRDVKCKDGKPEELEELFAE